VTVFRVSAVSGLGLADGLVKTHALWSTQHDASATVMLDVGSKDYKDDPSSLLGSGSAAIRCGRLTAPFVSRRCSTCARNNNTDSTVSSDV
jgi:hypothetical protein